MQIVNCSRYSRLSDTQFVRAPWWGVSKPPEKMFVSMRDMTIERTQVWNTMSNINSIIPLAIPVNDFFMIHYKSGSMRRATLEKNWKKEGESFLFLAVEFQPFFPFSPHPNKIALRISMEIYLKLHPGLFANRKETMAFVWRSPPRNRI